MPSRENKKPLLMLYKNKDKDLNVLETKGIARKDRVKNFALIAKSRDIKWTNVSNYIVTLIGTKENMGPRWLHKFQFKTTLSEPLMTHPSMMWKGALTIKGV